ncbi:MAG: MMPL family transporter [Dehalococcoidia bacterium]
MTAFPSPERLARFSTRRPWLVVAVWVALLVAGVVLASKVGDVLTASAENYVDTDSRIANTLLEDRFYGGDLPARETVVIQSTGKTVDDAEYQALVAEVTSALRGLPGSVAAVTNTYEAQAPGLVSEDRRTTILPVTLAGNPDDAEKAVKPLINAIERFDGKAGFTVVTGGDGSGALAFTETSKSDLETAEFVGVPIALVILVLVFGALVAAGIPLLLGIASIIIAVGLTTVIGQQFTLSTFVVNFVTTMGLAVGIDYTLLIVQRFREERRDGLERDEAIVKAGATASRSVLFSGMAVIVALCGMILVPNSIFRSLGVGAILVVATSVFAALTLLPAVLRLLGDRVNSVRIGIPGRRRRKVSERSFWDRSTGLVMRHPVISVVASVGLLVAAAAPLAGLKLGWVGISALPADTEAYRAFAILNEEFSAGILSPAEVVIDATDVSSPAITAATARLIDRLKADPEFGPATVETSPAGDLALIRVPLAGDPQDSRAGDAVQRLRDDYIPAAFAGVEARTLVTGMTAEGIDDTGVISAATIPVFAFVLGMSFIILLVVFRSIVVPLKAIVMNLLSVGAAYGLMVLVFQEGIGNELFGFQQIDRIESWVPLFMFATLFGLSMDYHVFLLSRIRERFEHTGNNAESVAYGVRSTAGMITGAAAIMVAVFGGFAAGQMVSFQQMGFGLAVAVLLDATIVRTVLVPASMALLGHWNWYLPSWLEWIPRVDVEGSSTADPAPRREPAGALGAEGFPGS